MKVSDSRNFITERVGRWPRAEECKVFLILSTFSFFLILLLSLSPFLNPGSSIRNQVRERGNVISTPSYPNSFFLSCFSFFLLSCFSLFLSSLVSVSPQFLGPERNSRKRRISFHLLFLPFFLFFSHFLLPSCYSFFLHLFFCRKSSEPSRLPSGGGGGRRKISGHRSLVLFLEELSRFFWMNFHGFFVLDIRDFFLFPPLCGFEKEVLRTILRRAEGKRNEGEKEENWKNMLIRMIEEETWGYQSMTTFFLCDSNFWYNCFHSWYNCFHSWYNRTSCLTRWIIEWMMINLNWWKWIEMMISYK